MVAKSSKINEDNLQNLNRESSRIFRNKRREINELETNNKKIRDLYRGINEFKKWYQHRINIIKEEYSNLLRS
jgi:hypothetical protein